MNDVYEITKPAELLVTVNVLGSEIKLSKEDAGIILGYMEGHDFMLALDHGQLMRVDIAEEDGQRVPYTMDEVIDLVCEWNYEQLEEAKEVIENPKDFAEYCEYKFTYDALKQDEIALDKMFAQTIYGRNVRSIAKTMIAQVGGMMPEEYKVQEAEHYCMEMNGQNQSEGRKR